MKTTVSLYDFERAFADAGRKDQFSYEGLKALFEYLEDCEDEDDRIEAVRDYLNDNTMLVGEPVAGVFLYQVF